MKIFRPISVAGNRHRFRMFSIVKFGGFGGWCHPPKQLSQTTSFTLESCLILRAYLDRQFQRLVSSSGIQLCTLEKVMINRLLFVTVFQPMR